VRRPGRKTAELVIVLSREIGAKTILSQTDLDFPGLGGTVPAMAAQESLPPYLAPEAGSPETGGSWFSPFRALKHRNYRLFFFGQLISLVGSWIQLAALMWLAYHLTGTSRWPGLVAAAHMLPAFLLGPWGGSLADRLPKRRLVFHTQTALMVLALLLSLCVYADQVTVWHLLAISLAIGVVNAVDLPARLAFLVEMVGKEDLVNAVGLNSLLFNLARAAGPLLCHCLLPLGGPAFCFFLNGLSFLAVLIALSRMRITIPAPRGEKSDGWSGVGAGFRFVLRHPILLILLPLTLASTFFGWPILALLPAIADRCFAAGDSGYNTLLSALGAGALIAAFVVAAFGSMSRRWVFISFGVGLATAGMVGLSLVNGLLPGSICCAFVGGGLIFFFTTSQSVFQLSATDENRGRVMGVYSIVLAGAGPLGNLLIGPAADRWGEILVLRFQGCAILAVALLALFVRLSGSRAVRFNNQIDPEPVILSFREAAKQRAA
jgi:MFS family permease